MLFRPIPDAEVVFRAVPEVMDYSVGDVFEHKGFMSTSRVASRAMTFGPRKDSKETTIGTLFEIRLPKGYNGIRTNANEAELILPHKSKFKVLSVQENVEGTVKFSSTVKENTTIKRVIVLEPVDE